MRRNTGSGGNVALVVSGCCLLVVAIGVDAAEAPPAQPWLHTFAPKRVQYVSSSGTGDGSSAKAAMGLNEAVAGSQAGDLYWLAEGTYTVGTVKLVGKGTKGAPILFRAMPGKRVTIRGSFQFRGPYNWVWGMEITHDRKDQPAGDDAACLSAGVHLINNIIHDSFRTNGIGGWDTGPGHVYYGNIVYAVGKRPVARERGYPIYTQNNYAKNGVK